MLGVEVAARPRTGRGGTDQRPGLVVQVTERAVLFFDDRAVRQVFVPFSIIKDWWFTATEGRAGLRVENLQRNDEVTLEVPRWFLIKEGMLK